MNQRNPQVDAYIAKSADFAKPILLRIRKAFLSAAPEIQEVIKWGVPHFEYRGLVGGMAAFKNHVSFGFWKAKLMTDPAGLLTPDGAASMCSVKVTSVKDLPADQILKSYVREAVRLNVDGIKAAPKPRSKQAEPAVPPDLASRLRKRAAAAKYFAQLSPSHRREYIEWIEEAKRAETRERRLEQAMEMLSDGKHLNWKYERASSRPAPQAAKSKPNRAAVAAAGKRTSRRQAAKQAVKQNKKR